MARRLDLETYFQGIRQGDRVIVSRAITLCESSRLEDRELASALLERCRPFTGQSIRLGITGSPGVGKSTFINRFGMELISLDHNVAVLAIDPSSSRSKGSILGDKTRMDLLAHHPQAYVRPSPSAGTLGGVAARTREAIRICEAAGYSWIIVETVGVGQSETDVRNLVDIFMLLLLPNAGDDLQGIKKGIMEMADLLVVNKADGPSLDAANRTKALYSQALRLFPVQEFGLKPGVLLASGLEGKGLSGIVSSLNEIKNHAIGNHTWEKRRKNQDLTWYEDAIREGLTERFLKVEKTHRQYESLKQEVISGATAPATAAAKLLNSL